MSGALSVRLTALLAGCCRPQPAAAARGGSPSGFGPVPPGALPAAELTVTEGPNTSPHPLLAWFDGPGPPAGGGEPSGEPLDARAETSAGDAEERGRRALLKRRLQTFLREVRNEDAVNAERPGG